MSSSSDPSKAQLYGVFQQAEDWRNRLHRKLAHKSLDIADEEMIAVDNSKKGMGIGGVLGIAALAAGSAIGGSLLTRPTAPVPVPAEPAIVQPSLDETDTDTINVIGFEE